MTEFALILPVFVLLVVGLLAFGRIFFYWIEANHLASETARWAVVDRNPYSDAASSSTPRRAPRKSSRDVARVHHLPGWCRGGRRSRVSSRSRSRSG